MTLQVKHIGGNATSGRIFPVYEMYLYTIYTSVRIHRKSKLFSHSKKAACHPEYITMFYITRSSLPFIDFGSFASAINHKAAAAQGTLCKHSSPQTTWKSLKKLQKTQNPK